MFTLVADALSHLISRAMASGLIKGVKMGTKEVAVSHLHCANNTILFLENDKDNFSKVLSLFHIFQLSSS